jgi:hypothetical protein
VKIDASTALWVVVDPTPHSTLPDICFGTDLAGLRLQFLGGLDLDRHPVVYDTQDEAVEDAKNRLLVRRVAEQIRIDRRVPAGEVVRITLHDKDGTVLFEGEVR